MGFAVLAGSAVVLGTVVAVIPTAGYGSCAETGPGRDADVGVAWWPLGYRCDYGAGVDLTLAPSVVGTLLAIALAGVILAAARSRPDSAAARGALAGLLVTAQLAATMYLLDLQLAVLALIWLAPLTAFVADHLTRPRAERAPTLSALSGLAVGASSSVAAVFLVMWGWPAVSTVAGPLVGAAAAYCPAWLLHPPRRRAAG